jgi:N6-adenosine-specific RNA methylase IME4
VKLNRDVLRQLPLALRIEIEENSQRKPLTQSEMAAQQRQILKALRKSSRQGQRTDLTSGKTLPEVEGHAATRLVGKLYGESHTQVEKRLAVVEAAEADPENCGPLVDDMNRTGSVNGVHKRLKVMRQAEAILHEPPPLPNRGPYRVIVADPPWPYDVRQQDPRRRATHPYPQMSIAQICAVDVSSLAHKDSILWLWCTNFHIVRYAAPVLDAWGFKEKTILTWAKDRFGTGDWLRGQTEQCILATRGKPTTQLTNQSTLLRGPMRKNSEKPVEFYDFIEKLCPAPRYAYLFSRYQHNDKWDCHGDEAPAPNTDSSSDDLSIPAFLRRAAP